MYVSIRRYEILDETDPDDVVRRVEEEFVPQVEQLAGFREYYVMRISPRGITSVTVCDTREAVYESELLAGTWVATVYDPSSFRRMEMVSGEAIVSQELTRL